MSLSKKLAPLTLSTSEVELKYRDGSPLFYDDSELNQVVVVLHSPESPEVVKYQAEATRRMVKQTAGMKNMSEAFDADTQEKETLRRLLAWTVSVDAGLNDDGSKVTAQDLYTLEGGLFIREQVDAAISKAKDFL